MLYADFHGQFVAKNVLQMPFEVISKVTMEILNMIQLTSYIWMNPTQKIKRTLQKLH